MRKLHTLTTLLITMVIGATLILVGALPLGMWPDERRAASFGLTALLMWVWVGWWASRPVRSAPRPPGPSPQP